MFLSLLDTFSQGWQIQAFVKDLAKPKHSLPAGCLLPWEAHVRLLSRKPFSVHLWRGIVIFSFECWSDTRWDNKPCQMERSRQPSLIYRTPNPISFLSLSAYEPQLWIICWWQKIPSVRRGQDTRWDQSFHPLPKPRWLWPRPRWSQYVWRGRTDSPLKPGALTDLLPHPPKQQGEGSISPPTPALQASLLLLCRPPVPHISPRHETPNEIMKSSGVCGAQLKVTAACEFTFKNN